MRKFLIIGCLPVLASTAVGAHAVPLQNGGAAGTTPPSASTTLYTDVPIGNWAYSAIRSLQAHGILVGYPKGYFTGQKVLSRYEFSVAINRCASMIHPTEPTDTTSQEAPGPGGSAVPANDLKELRRLFLEFRPQLVLLGVDFKTSDARLHKLQDKRLHADVAEALAAVTPKPADGAEEPVTSAPKPVDQRSLFQDVNWPSWEYDALKQLSPKELAIQRLTRALTRYAVAVAVKRCYDAFCDTEGGHSVGGPYVRSASSYDLNDVVVLHKLVRAFQVELPQLGMDLKPAEVLLLKAEEKRIQALETIDTRLPAVK